MKITYLSVGAIVIKKEGAEAGTPWKVLDVEGTIRLQRVGQPENVWTGESIDDVNRYFSPEHVDEMAEYLPANVKSVADIGYTPVHLEAMEKVGKHKMNSGQQFSGGVIDSLPTANFPLGPGVHVFEMDATELNAFHDLAKGINADRSLSLQILMNHQQLFDHSLKIDPERLSEILAGTKTHEIRVFDRDYQVGHTLKLNSYDRSAKVYTGQWAIVKVTNITAPGSYGLPENIGVMSIVLVSSSADSRPEVSMADVLANNNPVCIDLTHAKQAKMPSIVDVAAWLSQNSQQIQETCYSSDVLAALLASSAQPALTQASVGCLATALEVIADYTDCTIDASKVVCELTQMNSQDRPDAVPVVRHLMACNFKITSSVKNGVASFVMHESVFYPDKITDEAFARMYESGWGSDAHRAAITNHFSRR